MKTMIAAGRRKAHTHLWIMTSEGIHCPFCWFPPTTPEILPVVRVEVQEGGAQ